MTDIQPIYILGSILGALVKLVMLVICIVLVVKHKNTATILMVTGSILSMLILILNIVWPIVASRSGGAE